MYADFDALGQFWHVILSPSDQAPGGSRAKHIHPKHIRAWAEIGFAVGGTEYALRNLIFATIGLGGFSLLLGILHKLGTTQRMYEAHVWYWGM